MRIDAQPCALVRFQIGDVAGQQISALTELGILQGNQGSPHGRYGFVIVDDQLLLLHGRIRMHDGQHGACSDEHGDRRGRRQIRSSGAVRQTLGIAALLLRRREGNDDLRTSAVARH